MPNSAAGDSELIVAELLSNAVEQEPDEPVWLELVLTEDAIYLTVANRSAGVPSGGPTPSQSAIDDVLADRGRGLHIVAALADGMWIHSDGDWTAVSCAKRVAPG